MKGDVKITDLSKMKLASVIPESIAAKKQVKLTVNVLIDSEGLTFCKDYFTMK